MADNGRYRSRIPPAALEQVRMLQARIRADKYDVQAWEHLLDELRNFGNSDEVQAAYNELLTVFPTAALPHARYAELLMNSGEHDWQERVRSIFLSCLLNCPNVDLWSTYLTFIKKVNEGRGPDGLREVKNAYEFTLDGIGQDITSGPLWLEYLQLLQNPKPGTPAFNALFGAEIPPGMHGQEESHRLVVVRRVFQRAIVVPSYSLEALWRAYEQFENSGSNKLFARKAIEEQRPRYQQARQFLRDRRRKTEGLDFRMLAVPPGRGGQQQEEQVRLWKEYLEWERSNQQRLEPPLLQSRVNLAYGQAVMYLMHYPEVWLEYSRWHAQGGGGGSEQAISVLQRAAKALPECLMLKFAIADLEETQGRIEEARQVYEGIVAPLEAEAAADGAADAGPASGQLSTELGVVAWVQFMRFSRRSVWMDNAHRKVFMRAKKWARCTWHVYVESALIEWRNYKNSQSARKIFELGLANHTYLTDPEYISAYVDFLVSIGDTENARALFERVLTEDANRTNAKLWECYVEFEHTIGDLSTVQQLQQRAKDALGDVPNDALSIMLACYRFMDLYPCTPAQRRHLDRVLGLAPPEPPPPQPPAVPPPMPPPLHHPATPMPDYNFGGPMDFGFPGTDGPGWEDPLMQMAPAVAQFISALPPPTMTEGPFPDVDMVIDMLLAADLSPPAVMQACAEAEGWAPPPYPGDISMAGPSGMAGHSGRPGLGGMPSPMHGPNTTPPREEMGNGSGSHKRKVDTPGGDGDEDEGYTGANMSIMSGPPVKDVYRQRIKQRKKVDA